MKLFVNQNESPPGGRRPLDCAGRAQWRQRFRINPHAALVAKAASRFACRRSPKWVLASFVLIAFVLTARFCALAVDETNFLAPVTSRDFYNAGTKLLATGKFAGAEEMFQSALAAQDERVQPPALYNLGHARFDEGAEILKNGPDAQKAAAQGNAALAAGGQAIRQAESSLAQNNLDKMVAAYLEGRGARRELRDAEKAVQAAMETYGKTLQKWQRAADDFKSAAELYSADTNAARNAQIVERGIAKLVDSLRQMQEMSGAMGKQGQDLGAALSQLKGRIPASNAPPGAAGDDDADEPGVQPDSLAGQKEGASRQGDQLQIPLSPDQAGQILDGLSFDGSRRLPMSDKQGAPPNDKKGRDW
jgi:tetratricopeptide (TPR) repeat protein